MSLKHSASNKSDSNESGDLTRVDTQDRDPSSSQTYVPHGLFEFFAWSRHFPDLDFAISGVATCKVAAPVNKKTISFSTDGTYNPHLLGAISSNVELKNSAP
jgi:hypothetical protein